jgi:proline dehydrogenase
MRFLTKAFVRPGVKWASLTTKTSAATSVVDHQPTDSNNDVGNHRESGPPSPPMTKPAPPSVHDPSVARAEIERAHQRLDLSFENTKEAFKSKSNWELWRQYIVLRMCGIDYLVQHNAQVIAASRRILGKRLFDLCARASFYGHFVAGEDQEAIKPVVSKLRRFGVKSILDYSVEADVEGGEDHPGMGDRREGVISARTYYYSGEPECDRNMEIFLGCIDAVAHSTDSAGLAAVKLTALGRPRLLLQVSEAIAQTHQFFKLLTGTNSTDNLLRTRISLPQIMERLREFGIKTDEKEIADWFTVSDHNKDGYVDLYEWGHLLDHNLRLGHLFQTVNLKTGKLEPLITNLTEDEERQFSNMMHRLNVIVLRAVEKNVRVMVDAEQTYFQPAISRLTMEFMRRYNKTGPVIFNTYQAYLKDCLTQVKIDMHLAKRDDFYFGAKLVRGAYMVQERKRASELGIEDPINPNIEATNVMYNSVLKSIVEEVKHRPLGKVSVMCATHNEDSVRTAVKLMLEHNIGPNQRILCFAQLYGMCDQVTMSLGQAGFSAYKYVPYGEIDGVMPYLSRRAQENSSLLLKARKERRLIWSELKRRYLSGIWWYDPLKAEPVSVVK